MRTRNLGMFFMTALLTLVMTMAGLAQPGGHGHGQGRPGAVGHWMGAQLTDAQRQQLQDTVQQLRAEGATPEEIRAAVDALFDEWGIERPQHKGPQLTDAQRQQLCETIQQLREQGATPEEIHDAVAALFAEWGVEMPANFAGHKGRRGRSFMRGGHGPCRAQLTEEQRETLRTTVQNLRDQGATRREIHDAVASLFAEWGVEMPEHYRGCHGKKGRPRMQNLTEEQRRTIRDMAREMRQAGATREEIHDAVQKQLREWGFDSGDDDQGLLQENDGAIDAFNAPNPFNPTTTITYTLKEDGPVSVKIYNAQGQLIRTLVDGEAAAGTHRAIWDGRNDSGESLSSGAYFYKITANGETVTQRMTLMK